MEATQTLTDIRAHFPILQQEVNGHPLVYLDNGASTMRAKSVIETVNAYEMQIHSNVHRGVHFLSSVATHAMEEARKKVQRFLNAEHEHEIIFTSGTTEGINVVAKGLENEIGEGDEVLISTMEHHANIVPWQMLCKRTGAKLRIIPITDEGEIDIPKYLAMLNEHTAIVCIVQVSNALGTINPVRQMCEAAHIYGAMVLVDGAQAVAHMPVDVQDMACDYYVFSGHKLFGPTGTGILYGRAEALEILDPMMGGGEMIETVTFAETTYNKLPFRLEAGTPNISGNIGLGAAVDFVSGLDWEEVRHHEQSLLLKTLHMLRQFEGLRLIGESDYRSGVISFLIGDAHPFDLGTLLDKLGIAVRTGHHCTQPLMDHYGIPGTVRASFSIYNTLEEVDILEQALQRVVPMLG